VIFLVKVCYWALSRCKVSAVIGDHWHTQTADADILPVAHPYTDVGMCGSLDSSLGVKYEDIIPRWRDGKQPVIN